eukprot:TRINITY_DN67408_c1_g2_i5.p1 TRINITY_DN67408_c1_g2~~TRINITY_DN67408_c1_g2_i5.p1  ORF type:complete len:122 (-),score=9.36 TRINITY_DN67408_c1_g2_i5:513-878(-)
MHLTECCSKGIFECGAGGKFEISLRAPPNPTLSSEIASQQIPSNEVEKYEHHHQQHQRKRDSHPKSLESSHQKERKSSTNNACLSQFQHDIRRNTLQPKRNSNKPHSALLNKPSTTTPADP